jgi:O-antigen ligase
MVAIIGCFYVLKRREAHTGIYAGILSVILSSAVLTWSRGPLVALFGTLLIAGIIARDKRVVGIASFVAIIGGLMCFDVEGVKEMIFRAESGLYRVERWEQTLLRVREAPFFGEGISADRRITVSSGSTWNHSHNVYLATTLYGGLTGLILFLALLVVGLWRSIVCFRREEEFTYVGLLLFAFICMIFGNYRVISHPDAIWIYFWLPLAILAAKETSEYEDVGIRPEQRYPMQGRV